MELCLFCLEFPGVNKKIKIYRRFSKQYILKPLCLFFFWNSPFLSVTKVICCCMLMVPKSELFFSFCFSFFPFFFSFILFVVFFCLHLFLLGFVICCNGNLLYFLDQESSGDWSRTQGDYTEQWAIPKKNPNWWQGGWEHRFPMDIKVRACGNSRGQLKRKLNFQGCSWKTCGISMGLCFWPWDLSQPGVLQIFAEFSGVKVCFLRVKYQM